MSTVHQYKLSVDMAVYRCYNSDAVVEEYCRKIFQEAEPMKKRFLPIIALLVAAMLALAAVPAGAFTERNAAASGSDAALSKLFSDPVIGESHRKQYERFVNSASVAVNEYNANDVARIRDFMEQETNGIKNGYWFNENYNPDDPSTYFGTAAGYGAGAKFSASGRLEELFFLFIPVQGDLNLTGCDMLFSATLYCCDLSSIVVEGCTSLNQLDISYNEKIRSLDVSSCAELSELAIQGNSAIKTLDLSGHSKLASAYFADTPFTALNLDGCTGLETLSLSLTRFSELDLSEMTALNALYLDNTCLSAIDLSNLSNLETFGALGGETVKSLIFPKRSGSGMELIADGNGGVGYYMYADDNIVAGGAGSINPEKDAADGEYCICAYPSFGAEFIGWFDGDSLVSTDRRVAASFETDTRTLTAKFEGGSPMTTGSASDIHFMRAHLNCYTYVGEDLWKHGYYLNENYDSDDFTTFANVTFNSSNRISAIDYSGKMLQGPITLQYPELESFNMEGSNLSGLTCIDCDALTEIYASNSNIVLQFDVSGAPNLRTLEISGLSERDGQRTEKLDLSKNHELQRLEAVNSLFKEIIVDPTAFGGRVELKADGGLIGCTYADGIMTACARETDLPFAGWLAANGTLLLSDAQCVIAEPGSYTALFSSDPITLAGDADGNGKVEIADAVLTARHALGLELLDGNALSAADVNDDGEIRIDDAVLICRIALGLYGI